MYKDVLKQHGCVDIHEPFISKNSFTSNYLKKCLRFCSIQMYVIKNNSTINVSCINDKGLSLTLSGWLQLTYCSTSFSYSSQTVCRGGGICALRICFCTSHCFLIVPWYHSSLSTMSGRSHVVEERSPCMILPQGTCCVKWRSLTKWV